MPARELPAGNEQLGGRIVQGYRSFLALGALLLTAHCTSDADSADDSRQVSSSAAATSTTSEVSSTAPSSSSDGPTSTSTAPLLAGTAQAVTDGKKCSLHLHWAGGNGQADASEIDGGGFWKLRPSSPDGALWLYDGERGAGSGRGSPAESEAAYQRIVGFLDDYLEQRDCGPVVVIGYSNGGGLAAKLLCRGVDFGGRAWAFIVDDPVMDDGVRNCAPSPQIREVVFTHSEELSEEAAAAGGECSVTGWYCENGRTMSVEQYQQLTGYPSVLSRELHSGGGWEDSDYATHFLEYVVWTERFAP